MKECRDEEANIRSRRKGTFQPIKRLTSRVCLTGGVASVETVKIIRELRRRGGEVTVFMTPSAARFITPLSFE